MRTTLNISDALMKELMSVTDAKTKTKAIDAAIREYIRKRKIKKLQSLSGKIEIVDNWRELRESELEER